MTQSKENSFCYPFPRPSVSVDCVIFGWNEKQPQILLIERGNDPFKGMWALPGGFVDQDEDLDVAAARELREETNLDSLSLNQIGTFGKPGRDPRTHVISVAYLAFVNPGQLQPVAGDDAVAAKWFALEQLPKLAFDHAEIVKTALDRVDELKQLGRDPFGLSVNS